VNENWGNKKFHLDKNWQTKNGEMMRIIQKFRQAGQGPLSFLTMAVNACHGAGNYHNLTEEAGLW
jgi:hypothetical protein